MNLAVWIVAAVSFAVGLAAGYFMHRSDFCLAGAIRDLFLFRSTHRLGALLLLVTISAILFEIFRQLSWLPAYPFPWFAPPSLTNLIGGFFFGVGMVFAGGCVVGVLYKFGGGSLLAGIAILGLLAGSGLYAEFHPAWVGLARQLQLQQSAVTLPQATGIGPFWWILLLTSLGSYGSWRWWQQERKKNVSGRAEGYIPLWVTSIVLSFLGLASVLLTGVPMGVTTTYAKVAAWFETAMFPVHVAGLAFFNGAPVHLALPFSGLTMAGGAGAHWDVITLLQVPLILGIVLGAMLSAMLLGELRFYGRLPRRQIVVVFCGGIVMALGSRMTPGCNVWHLLGGLPILATQSLLFMLGLFPGAWLGGQMMKRILV